MTKSRKNIWYFSEVDIKYSECFDTFIFAFNGAGRKKSSKIFLLFLYESPCLRVRSCVIETSILPPYRSVPNAKALSFSFRYN